MVGSTELQIETRADRCQVRAVTNDNIGLKVLYEPPAESQDNNTTTTSSVEYDCIILIEIMISQSLTLVSLPTMGSAPIPTIRGARRLTQAVRKKIMFIG